MKKYQTAEVHQQMLEALKATRALVSEAAMTGFLWDDGDWADRLYVNQGVISNAIAAAECQSVEKTA